MVKNILWKYDSQLGWAYFCPNCKNFLCMNEKKCNCGQEINWSNPVKYEGKTKWQGGIKVEKVIQAISQALDIIKNFDTGTTTRSDNRMIIDFKEKRYVLTVSKIENPSDDMFKDIEKYL